MGEDFDKSVDSVDFMCCLCWTLHKDRQRESKGTILEQNRMHFSKKETE